MKKVLTSLMTAVMFAGYAYGVSTVSSWSTVKLVEEINEALASPSVTSLTVEDSATIATNLMVGGVTTTESAVVVGSLEVGNGLDVGTNASIGGKVYITGVISNTALTASKPVFTDANKQLVSTGTLAVDQGGSGAATFTDNGVLIGNAAAAFSVTAVGTAVRYCLEPRARTPHGARWTPMLRSVRLVR